MFTIRPLEIARFISLFLTGMASGVVYAHVIKKPGKAELSAPAYLDVQQVLYREYGKTMGVIEGNALLTTFAALFLGRGRRTPLALTSVAAACLVAMIGIWAALINPINKEVNALTVDSLPENWTKVRDRWESLHAIRAGCSLVALGAQILATMTDAPEAQRRRFY